MIIVTGLLVTDFTFSSMAGPVPGTFVSTTTTPFSVKNTAVLPPPPVIIKRLSLTFCISNVAGRGCCCCCAAIMETVPAMTRHDNTANRFIEYLLPEFRHHIHRLCCRQEASAD